MNKEKIHKTSQEIIFLIDEYIDSITESNTWEKNINKNEQLIDQLSWYFNSISDYKSDYLFEWHEFINKKYHSLFNFFDDYENLVNELYCWAVHWCDCWCGGDVINLDE